MVEKNKIDFEQTSYIFGILSIIFGILSPLIGIVLGIVGLNLSKKDKSTISKKARKLNIIGIALGVAILILTIILSYYLKLNPLQNFPVA